MILSIDDSFSLRILAVVLLKESEMMPRKTEVRTALISEAS